VTSPGTVHVHSKVTQANVTPEVISGSQATEASDKTAPETLGVQMTPSTLCTATRSFEDFSLILSTSQIKKKEKQEYLGVDGSDIHPETKRKRYLCLGKKERLCQ
jgi:hypothetical protein